MKKIYLLVVSMCLTAGVQAQNTTSTSSANNKNLTAAEKAIQQYNFEDAATQLQKEIATAKRNKRDVTSLQNALKKANMGWDMMNGIEKVVFVDSIITDKQQFLKAYRLSTDIGSLSATTNLPAGMVKGKAGKTFFTNDLNDMILYAAPDSSGQLKIHRADKIDSRWVSTTLNGLSNRLGQQDYPFMMSDGTTLYFSENGPESLGGYDLFVTRYNSSTREYLKPENLGMPFNSPYNDYMLVIDEPNNIGWFASDRYQPNGKVCIYLFVPNDTKDIYLADDMSEGQLKNLARFAAASYTSENQSVRKDALARLQKVSNTAAQNKNKLFTRCVLDNRHVYTSLNDFKVPQAAQLAVSWNEAVKSLSQVTSTLEQLRLQYAQAPQAQAQQLKNSILKLEAAVQKLTEDNAQLLNQIRNLELKQAQTK